MPNWTENDFPIVLRITREYPDSILEIDVFGFFDLIPRGRIVVYQTNIYIRKRLKRGEHVELMPLDSFIEQFKDYDKFDKPYYEEN